LTLEAADAWLAGLLESPTGRLSAALRAMSLPALVDDLLAATGVADRAEVGQERDELWEYFQVTTGLPAEWRGTFASAAGPKAEAVPVGPARMPPPPGPPRAGYAPENAPTA